MRGMLTDKIQEKTVSFLNREITQKELRLYPYIDDVGVKSFSIVP